MQKMQVFEVLTKIAGRDGKYSPSIGPKYFEPSKLFWSGLIHFGWVQIILVRFKLDFSGLFFIILGRSPRYIVTTE